MASSESQNYQTPGTPISPPPDAYSLRALEEQRMVAVDAWTKKSKIICGAQLIAAGLMLYSIYWYAQIIGLVMFGVGFYGIVNRRNEFTFMYIILSFLVLFKDAMLIYLYLKNGHVHGYDVLVVILCFVDALVLIPIGAHHAYYFYQSLQTNLTFEKLGN